LPDSSYGSCQPCFLENALTRPRKHLGIQPTSNPGHLVADDTS
jgi:hypothetical protein